MSNRRVNGVYRLVLLSFQGLVSLRRKGVGERDGEEWSIRAMRYRLFENP